ncbi:dihydropteroate synthase [Rhizobium sp. KVB221]|uniref:Dihydropteroate synthase n=1 Tax=Rhizobium setariae TaxID=2801340 RepID=A0A936YU35_9HYPH|nr:dihydropteroate synthase [Rhizobium setariae]MBL0375041.1 dihydropteroate synthase [Rhizobium setariae]
MPSPFDPFSWQLAHGRSLCLGPKARLMAILNVTPDSFSDGGSNATTELAIENALKAVADGADIVDIGGESTRPGAAAVCAAEEQDRVLPVIEALARQSDVLISIDTYRAETARRAIAAGAHIVNDVHGLQREPDIALVVAESGAGVVVMHTGRGREKHADVIADQFLFLRQSLAIAAAAGIRDSQILLDPGFGFNKETADDNFDLMARIGELFELSHPLLIGASRKRFLGAVTGRDAPDRDTATAATSVITRMAGAAVFRVHDVAINRDALLVADAMLKASLKYQNSTHGKEQNP